MLHIVGVRPVCLEQVFVFRTIRLVLVKTKRNKGRLMKIHAEPLSGSEVLGVGRVKAHTDMSEASADPCDPQQRPAQVVFG